MVSVSPADVRRLASFVCICMCAHKHNCSCKQKPIDIRATCLTAEPAGVQVSFFNGRWMEPRLMHGAKKKHVLSKSDNSVILFWLLRQQVDVDRQPCSFAHLCSPTIFHHFFILTFSQYPFYPFPHTSSSIPPPCPSPFLSSFPPTPAWLLSSLS